MTTLENGFHDIPPGKVAMIVTYLEMRAPADCKAIELPGDVSLRRVDASPDWYRDVFKRVGSQDWLWYGRLKLNDTELSAILDDPAVEIYTLQTSERDEALLELDFRTPGECELAYFGLTSALIGTGSGRFLMNEAIRRAFEKPISRFHVHTCTIDSPQALGFYRRSGFVPVRQRVEIDDDPRSLGILPSHMGPNVPVFDP